MVSTKAIAYITAVREASGWTVSNRGERLSGLQYNMAAGTVRAWMGIEEKRALEEAKEDRSSGSSNSRK